MTVRTIIRIEVAGPDRKARRLSFGPEDERLSSAAALRAMDVQEGDAIDLDELSKVEAQTARDRALRYLGYRDRTVHEVMKRLKDDGYGSEISESVCQRLCELEFIDDVRLARNWARSRASSGYGPRRILQDLIQRGVSDETAKEALGRVSGDEYDRARATLRGKVPADSKQRQRMVKKLVSRGFDLATALKVLDCSEDDC